MSAVRRIYRATAVYPDHEETRHFLTRRARERWAEHRRAGYEAEEGDFLTEGRPAIPPADRVDTTDSEPVVWP